MSSTKVFSILGKNLKAETGQDLEPYLTELKEMEDVEEVHFGGNSLGVDACKAIAETLKTKKQLKVCFESLGFHIVHQADDELIPPIRLQTLQTFSLVV
jgi:Ran GTPase-activating protein (RanGAP) involved in mRNA processing and transport